MVYFFFLSLLIITVLLIFYTYVIFPFLLKILSARKIVPADVAGESTISVSIIMSVFNEEEVIEEKLAGIINGNYEHAKMEILIGSDDSNDRTCELIRPFTDKYPFIRLFEFTERRGKPAVINELVSEAKHDIIVLTDANVFFEKDLLANLTKHFTNENIGLVGANILNVGIKKTGISLQEKSYIARENLIKYREGLLWGCMMGPFGGCYALRKSLYEEVPAGFLVDDFFIAMNVIRKGFACINDLDAICYEDVSNDISQEYRRKARISAGNYQNLKMFRRFLFRPFSPAGFCFISHKFLRWIAPFLIITSLVSLAVLTQFSDIFLWMFCFEMLLLLSPLIDSLAKAVGLHLKFLRFVSYFSYMNLALLKGFFKYMKGIKSGIWTPTKRQ